MAHQFYGGLTRAGNSPDAIEPIVFVLEPRYQRHRGTIWRFGGRDLCRAALQLRSNSKA